MNELLERARAGDSAAFEALVTPYEAQLWRLCWSYTRREADAADCLQETMIKAWKSLPRFRGDCAVETWLYRLCVNCCLDFLRSRTRQEEKTPSSLDAMEETGNLPKAVGADPAEAAEKAAYKEAVREAVDLLSPPFREALLLTQVAGCGYDEAAERLGISTGTIRSRVNRAREKLKQLMSGWPELSPKEIVKRHERRGTK